MGFYSPSDHSEINTVQASGERGRQEEGWGLTNFRPVYSLPALELTAIKQVT